MTLSEIVMQAVRNMLDETGGNVSEAARRLGVNRRTLIRWRNGWEPNTGLPRPRPKCLRCNDLL